MRSPLIHAKVFLWAAVCGLAAYGVVFLLVRLERFVLGGSAGPFQLTESVLQWFALTRQAAGGQA
jgi:hypothetical protein